MKDSIININTEKIDTKILLSTLWILITINFIFCDVFSLMNPEDLRAIYSGNIDGVVMTEQFLLTFALIMEIPMIMILLSRLLSFKWNKWINIITGFLMIIIQSGSLFVGGNSMHYIFFSIVEIAVAISITWIAFKWNNK